MVLIKILKRSVALRLLAVALVLNLASCSTTYTSKYSPDFEYPDLKVKPLALNAALVVPKSDNTQPIKKTISCVFGSSELTIPVVEELQREGISILSQGFKGLYLVSDNKDASMGKYDVLIELIPSNILVGSKCFQNELTTFFYLMTWPVDLLYGWYYAWAIDPHVSAIYGLPSRVTTKLLLTAKVNDTNGSTHLAEEAFESELFYAKNNDAGLGLAIQSALRDALTKMTKRLATSPGLIQYAQSLPGTPEERAKGAKEGVVTASLRTIKSDVDQLSALKMKPNRNAHAIVIGVEQYREKLPRADYATHDANTVTEYLTKMMGYPEENVITLLNDKASKSDLEKYIEKWLPNNVDKDGTLFICYSGHGAPNPKTGDAYLVPYDGDPTFIEQTGYSLKRLYESLSRLKAKEIVVVLDSCFSGAGGRSVIAKGARPMVITIEGTMPISQNVAVISAAGGEEISSTYDEKGHGLFTYFMLKGLKGEADTDANGKIEIQELYNYIKPQVERISRRVYNNEQTPQLVAPPERQRMTLIEGAR